MSNMLPDQSCEVLLPQLFLVSEKNACSNEIFGECVKTFGSPRPPPAKKIDVGKFLGSPQKIWPVLRSYEIYN